jgi:hypothetical protein
VERSLSQAPNSAVQVDDDSDARRGPDGRQYFLVRRTTTIDLGAYNVACLLRDRNMSASARSELVRSFPVFFESKIVLNPTPLRDRRRDCGSSDE